MFLGIEIGGTKLQLGLGEGDGILRGVWRGQIDVILGADGIRRQIQAAVPELLSQASVQKHQLRGVGIGFGGPVDDTAQATIKSHHVEGWDQFPLAGWMQDRFGWPTVMGNDADVAGLAEALVGEPGGFVADFLHHHWLWDRRRTDH